MTSDSVVVETTLFVGVGSNFSATVFSPDWTQRRPNCLMPSRHFLGQDESGIMMKSLSVVFLGAPWIRQMKNNKQNRIVNRECIILAKREFTTKLDSHTIKSVPLYLWILLIQSTADVFVLDLENKFYRDNPRLTQWHSAEGWLHITNVNINI